MTVVCMCVLTVLCDELCMSESYAEAITPEAHNLALFGDGSFAEAIKARLHGSQAMVSGSPERKTMGTDTHRGDILWERDSTQGEAPETKEPRVTSISPEAERGTRTCSLQPQRDYFVTATPSSWLWSGRAQSCCWSHPCILRQRGLKLIHSCRC